VLAAGGLRVCVGSQLATMRWLPLMEVGAERSVEVNGKRGRIRKWRRRGLQMGVEDMLKRGCGDGRAGVCIF